MAPDNELICAYVAERSETAFHALVTRHVDLVFATALRQVGDRGLAEEITQNVFVTLARKSPSLRGMETLAGWLHRTAILESKTRIRGELRRKRREETAATLHEIATDGDSTVAALIPLVDEALLHLRESDRVAIVLRYLEDRSLREVGEVLGVNEDAARKRVSRALEQITDFFKRRGFIVPVALGTAVLTSGTKAAPVGLANSVTRTALTAAAGGGLLRLLYVAIFGLTKTQAVVIASVVVGIPLLYQERAIARVEAERAAVTAHITEATEKNETLQRQLQHARNVLAKTEENLRTAEARVATLQAQSDQRSPAEYKWDDNAALMRVRKSFLFSLSIEGIRDRRGKLSDQIVLALQLTPAEQLTVQDTIDGFLMDYDALVAAHTRQIPPTEDDKTLFSTDDVRVFEVKAAGVAKEIGTLCTNAMQRLEATLGEQRRAALVKSFGDWVSLQGDSHFSGSVTVVDYDHTLVFGKPEPDDTVMPWCLRRNNQGHVSSSISFEEIPPHLRAQLADWIAFARNNPAKPQP